MVQTGPTIDHHSTYKRKIAPGRTVKIFVSASRYRLITISMNAKLLIALTLNLLAFAIAEDATTLEQMENKLSRAMDNLNRMDTIKIYGDMITLEKMHVDEEAESARSSQDPLVSRIEQFFRSRRIQLHLPNDGSSADMFGRALGQKDMGVELRGLTKGASEGEIIFEEIEISMLFKISFPFLLYSIYNNSCR